MRRGCARVGDRGMRRGDAVAAARCVHPGCPRGAPGHRAARTPPIPGGVLFGLLLTLAIVYTPHGNAFLGTAPIGAAPWLFVLPFAAALIGLEFVRRRMKLTGPNVAPPGP